MFLGDERAHTLECFLSAYDLGRIDAGLPGLHPDDEALLAAFNVWLLPRTQALALASTGRWLSRVKMIDSSEKNVATFFHLFEKFLRSRGSSFEDVPFWKFWGSEPQSTG